jgi:hypothetical protein
MVYSPLRDIGNQESTRSLPKLDILLLNANDRELKEDEQPGSRRNLEELRSTRRREIVSRAELTSSAINSPTIIFHFIHLEQHTIKHHPPLCPN